MKVSAKDLGTGREQNITITGSTNLSENEIQRAMADAAAYEAEDSRRKERLDLHNQAEVLAYKVDEALSKCKKELDKEEKNRIKADVALRRCLRKDKRRDGANLSSQEPARSIRNHLMVLFLKLWTLRSLSCAPLCGWADVANLRRCLRKDKPEKMNETEEANLRQAKSQLEASANHLMLLYASEQGENGSDGNHLINSKTPAVFAAGVFWSEGKSIYGK